MKTIKIGIILNGDEKSAFYRLGDTAIKTIP